MKPLPPGAVLTLTEREHEVFLAVAEGCRTYGAIADSLGLSSRSLVVPTIKALATKCLIRHVPGTHATLTPLFAVKQRNPHG